jgi:RHS repeat-associated protein
MNVHRRRFMPYGEPRGTQPTWIGTKGYVDGTKDPTGLTHLGVRGYDPTIGRFISVDPMFDGADPQSWNGYAYSDNGPVTLSDPNGTCVMDEDTGICDRASDRSLAEQRAKSRDRAQTIG